MTALSNILIARITRSSTSFAFLSIARRAPLMWVRTAERTVWLRICRLLDVRIRLIADCVFAKSVLQKIQEVCLPLSMNTDYEEDYNRNRRSCPIRRDCIFQRN